MSIQYTVPDGSTTVFFRGKLSHIYNDDIKRVLANDTLTANVAHMYLQKQSFLFFAMLCCEIPL